MIDMETESKTFKIFDFFDKSEFMIPEIQRNYTWTEKDQVRKLLQDIIKFSNVDHSHVPNYFLGTCIMYEGSEYGGAMQIMDGQQRVTSIMAFYCAIKSHLEKKARTLSGKQKDDIEDYIELISEKIIFSDEGFQNCRLNPKSKSDKTIVEQMVKLNGDSLEEKFDKNTASGMKLLNSPLAKAFTFFFDKLSSHAEKKSPENPHDYLIELSMMVGNRIILTKTVTKTLPMAFQMFVSVNGAGKPLISYDVLRGIAIAKAHSLGIQKKVNPILRSLNSAVEELRNTASKEEAADTKVTDCLLYWLESRKGKNIQNNQVVSIIENDIQSFENLDSFDEMFEEFESFVKLYTWINDPNTRKMYDTLDKGARNRILCLTGVSKNWKANHIGVLVCLHMMGSTKREVMKVMQLIEWVVFRGFNTQISNKLENLMPQIARLILDGKSIDDWGDEFIRKMKDLLANLGASFDPLYEARLSMNEAKGFLHKITNCQLNPYDRDLVTAQFLPESSPSPWNVRSEKNEPKSVSNLIGNYFLVSKQNQTDLKRWKKDPLPRISMIKKYSVKGTQKATVEHIEKQVLMNPNHFTSREINRRTSNLIRELDILFPKDGPKFNLPDSPK